MNAAPIVGREARGEANDATGPTIFLLVNPMTLRLAGIMRGEAEDLSRVLRRCTPDQGSVGDKGRPTGGFSPEIGMLAKRAMEGNRGNPAGF